MEFRGEYYFLSNFWLADFTVSNVKYKSVEHFFQAMKAVKTEDFLKIINAERPSTARSLGKEIQLRSDWNKIRVSVMEKGVFEKFRQNPKLRQKLIEIEGDIVEENTWGDKYWGVCDGEGENMLGKILMEVRSYFHKQVLDFEPVDKQFHTRD